MPRNDTPTSRRERPAKPALSRAGIVEAALGILREEGLARVTMRRIAAVLDTGPASLYAYVHNTEDLHAQILDALLAPVPAPLAAGSWRERLGELLARYRDVLFAHPEIARMAVSTRPDGPHHTAVVEAILGLLAEAGATDRAAAWGVDLLLLYPTAIAAEHSSASPVEHEIDHSADHSADLARLGERIAAADPRQYPNIARLGPALVSGAPGERFDWALDVLLAGILADRSEQE
jgi:AcrR family transcriptional regulator